MSELDRITGSVLNGVVANQNLLVEKQVGSGYVTSILKGLMNAGHKAIIVDALSDSVTLSQLIKKDKPNVIVLDISYQSVDNIRDIINVIDNEKITTVCLANSQQPNIKELKSLQDLPEELKSIRLKNQAYKDNQFKSTSSALKNN